MVISRLFYLGALVTSSGCHKTVLCNEYMIPNIFWSAHHGNVMWIYCTLRRPPEKLGLGDTANL